nr:hypothetical protein [Phycisphaerales bacterium]
IFRIFEGPGQMFQKVGDTHANTQKADASPFDLVLARSGDDFAVMGMHFKLGLYEHQSAGALQGLINIIARAPQLLDDQSGDNIASMVVKAYEPAFGIIGDPAKRDPRTRQSADHSMLYLVCTMLRKALEIRAVKPTAGLGWKELMLTPHDFDRRAIHHELTRALMAKMTFEWGGTEYDSRYPDGIPTSIVVTDDQGNVFDSGLVMYPGGHARNHAGPDVVDLRDILGHKFQVLGALAVADPQALVGRLESIERATPQDVAGLYDFKIESRGTFE